MEIPFALIDSFTDKLFGGNPVAVCLLPSKLKIGDDFLQNIAKEFGYSETAFLERKEEDFHIRWFSPKMEVGLCGHATLAAAFFVFSNLESHRKRVKFWYGGGEKSLLTWVKNNQIGMDFPAFKYEIFSPPKELEIALGGKPELVFKNESEWFAVFNTQEEINNLVPDNNRLRDLPVSGIGVTALGGKEIDFVSRYFAPKEGIPEDPVCGSAHCTLVPYWSAHLKKNSLTASQQSILLSRRGILNCELRKSRVIIFGKTVLFAKGQLILG